ncbi:MAG TPA: hypothetical protein VFG50_10535 [Rhodothermales bacterium]|nr:hypothetical protein [Rhodothermales bacterium]
MKKLLRSTLVLCTVTAFAIPPASAQVSVSSSVFFGSPYVWRGEVLSGGWVFQPSISAGYGGFSATFFGNVDPNSVYVHDKVHWQEADLTLAYGTSLSDVALTAGYTLYNFPTPAGDEIKLLNTQELFGSVGLASGPVQPSLFVAYDFDDNAENPLKGLYAEGKVAVPFESGGQNFNFAATLGLDAGYYQKYYLTVDPTVGDDQTSLSHLALSVATSFDAGPVTLSPLAALQISLDDTYKQAFGNRFFYGGFTIAF